MFISTGEKLDAIDVFYPDRMAQRILGMGDVISFVERAQQAYDEKEAAALERKMKRNKLDFNDFLAQTRQLRKMGDLKSLMSMIPGMNKMTQDLDIDDRALIKVESIVFSMTPYERANPDAMTTSRKRRIAMGCGRSIDEINQFLKSFEQMRKMMHRLSNMSPAQMQAMAKQGQ